MADEELQLLAQRLAVILDRGLGARSRFALETALIAAETEGLSGVMLLDILADNKGHSHVNWSTKT